VADAFRGIVVSAPVKIDGPSLQIVNSGISPQELRFALLFWDRIDFPENNFINIGASPEFEFLVQEGIAQRTRIDPIIFGTVSGARVFRDCHVAAFKKLNERNPGCWATSSEFGAIVFNDKELEAGRGLLVTLHDCLPVPDQDVPLQDVLDFKAKRRSELLALRDALDEAYLKIAASPDRDFALSSEIARLQRACTDYLKSAKGFGLDFRMMDMTANINLIAGAIAAQATFAATGSAPLAIGAAAAASIGVKAGPALKLKQAPVSPFQYVARYHREVFTL